MCVHLFIVLFDKMMYNETNFSIAARCFLWILSQQKKKPPSGISHFGVFSNSVSKAGLKACHGWERFG